MLRYDTDSDIFVSFFEETEPRLRRALSAAFGAEIGREAAADALAYGWHHWDRIGDMENPAGYLYRVGMDRARRMKPGAPRVDRVPPARSEVWVEPALPAALEGLSDRQRIVISLLHAFDWSMSEVADLLGVSKSTIQSYERRAMRKLRRSLGVVL